MLRRASCAFAVTLGVMLQSGLLRAQDQATPPEPSVASPPMSPMQPMSSVSGSISMPANLSIYPEHTCESCARGAGACGSPGCCCFDRPCPEEACSCRCPGYEPLFPGWYVEADALIVTRNNGSINQPVVLADDTGDTVLSTHDLNFDWDGGFRLFVGHELSKCSGWEIGYFGIYGGVTSATAEVPNNLDIPSPLGSVSDDFFLADTMTLTWSWTVSNAEFNVYHQFGRIQTLAGFRYFNLEERFNIHAVDADSNASDYPITTSNNLYGGQLGARTYCQWKCFRFGATGKAGVYGNDAVERQTVFDDNNTFVLRNAQGRASSVSFVGDVNAYATLSLSHNWRFRAGYYLLYASNVALAPDQLDFSFNADSGTQVHNSGNLFLHGVTAGLEAAW